MTTTFRGMLGNFWQAVTCAAVLLAASSRSQAEDQPGRSVDYTLPSWEMSLGAGGYFFEGGSEYDPGGLYTIQGTYFIDPRWSVDALMGGLPQLNDNPPAGLVPPPADVHNWGLLWAADVNYHLNGDPGRRWDPYLSLGVGLDTLRKDIEGDRSHVFGDAGVGLRYRLNNPAWSVRGDYKVLLASGDDVQWNQIGLVSVGYSWGTSRDVRGAQEADQAVDGSTIDNRELGLKTVYFDFDSSSLRPEAKATLRQNAEWMKQNADEKVILEGHCDERGTNEYNIALGERRARAAFDYLRSLGVPAAQMSTISYGEERPAEAGHNETAWAKNRRVECRGQ